MTYLQPASFSVFAERNIRPTPGRMRKTMSSKQNPRPKTAVYRSPRHFPFSRTETFAPLRANEENDVFKTKSPSKDGGLSQPASFSVFAERNSRPTPGRERKMMLPKQRTPSSDGVFVLVGIVRLERTNEGVKDPCLTAWLYPNFNEKGTGKTYAFSYLGWVVGVEPTIFGTTIRRFNQLSHTHHVWHAMKDSNLRPTA